MASKLNIYDVGGGGVNLVKNPLQLADNELTKGQNVEFIPDAGTGGQGALTKRGGLAALNSAALAGSVLGLVGLNLETTYTRTLYAARGSEDANAFLISTNGTTWTDSSSPIDPATFDKYTDANTQRDARRHTAYKNFIIYPSDEYTQDTDNPPIALWDSTNALEIGEITIGPSATALTPAFAITDLITANGIIYFAVHDPGGSAPDLAGRVMSLDLQTGVIEQIAAPFGSGTGEETGGYPSALAFYQNQLFVGLNGSTTTNGIGKIVRCFPTLDTTWTDDVTNLNSHISSLCVFAGDLYAGVQSSVSDGATISKRTASTGAWTTVATSSGGAAGNGHYASLTLYDDAIYCVEYWSGGTDIVHILRSTDGSSWATDRDVDANDSPSNPPQLPGSMAILGDDLYVVFRANSATATDGFIMRRSGGSWTKVATDNFGGPLVVLVDRS